MTSNQACFMHCDKLSEEPKTQKASGWYPSIPHLTTAASDTGLYSTSLSKVAFVRRIEVHKPFSLKVDLLIICNSETISRSAVKTRRSRTKGNNKKRMKKKIIHCFFPDWTEVEGHIWHLHNIITENLFLWLKTKRFYLLVNINDANLNQIFISLLISHPCSSLFSY